MVFGSFYLSAKGVKDTKWDFPEYRKSVKTNARTFAALWMALIQKKFPEF